jgi:GTP-binding protein
MPLPMVAVIGRPNVGKSSLFNRIVGSRVAVVHEDSGVTRDRHVQRSDWNGLPFLLVDTGGMTPVEEGAPFEEDITRIAQEAAAMADVLLWVVDAKTGITASDEMLGKQLRRAGKPLILVANKADGPLDARESGVFARLGVGEPMPVSAVHGHGVGDLLDRLVQQLPQAEPEPEADLRIALVGRPNVGKSSLLNALLHEERALVSETPGTTRDAIDSPLLWREHRLLLVDTAGIRRRVSHEKGIEYFSVLRSLQAIERCDVAVLMLDAKSGIVAQDARVAGEIHDLGKACVIVWNKWDLVPKQTMTYREFEKRVQNELPFLGYAPILTISARDRLRLERLLEQAWEVGQAAEKTVETSRLNDILAKALAMTPPKVHNKGTGKVYYATQTGVKPPTFTLFVNNPDWFPRNYLRYLNNQLRDTIGFPGNRVRLKLRART